MFLLCRISDVEHTIRKNYTEHSEVYQLVLPLNMEV